MQNCLYLYIALRQIPATGRTREPRRRNAMKRCPKSEQTDREEEGGREKKRWGESGRKRFCSSLFSFLIPCETEGYFGVYAFGESHSHSSACIRAGKNQSNLTAWQWKARGPTNILHSAWHNIYIEFYNGWAVQIVGSPVGSETKL